MLMDKGEYKQSVKLLKQVEDIVLGDESIGLDYKIDLLVGKVSMQVIIGEDGTEGLLKMKDLVIAMRE